MRTEICCFPGDWVWWSSLGLSVLRVLSSTLRTKTEMVFETLVFSPLNHLTQLIAWENFINMRTVFSIAYTMWQAHKTRFCCFVRDLSRLNALVLKNGYSTAIRISVGNSYTYYREMFSDETMKIAVTLK